MRSASLSVFAKLAGCETGSGGEFVDGDLVAEAEADRRLLVPGTRSAAWMPVPERSGQWEISLRAWKDGLSSEWTMAASLPGSVPPSGFEKWIQAALPHGLPPHAYAPESNEDMDTLPALLEYAVGRSPVLGEYAPLLAFDPYDDSMPPVLTEAVVREDVKVLIQESEDLNRWFQVPSIPPLLEKPVGQVLTGFFVPENPSFLHHTCTTTVFAPIAPGGGRLVRNCGTCVHTLQELLQIADPAFVFFVALG